MLVNRLVEQVKNDNIFILPTDARLDPTETLELYQKTC